MHGPKAVFRLRRAGAAAARAVAGCRAAARCVKERWGANRHRAAAAHHPAQPSAASCVRFRPLHHRAAPRKRATLAQTPPARSSRPHSSPRSALHAWACGPPSPGAQGPVLRALFAGLSGTGTGSRRRRRSGGLRRRGAAPSCSLVCPAGSDQHVQIARPDRISIYRFPEAAETQAPGSGRAVPPPGRAPFA